VIVAFTEDRALSDAATERPIADIAKTAYRHFTSRPR
jgi:hypothetical protein